VFLTAALVLAGCGGGGSAASTTIDVTMTEFSFTPMAFTVPAGKQITVNAHDTGADTHSFVIMKFGTTVGDDFGPEDEPNVYWQMEFQPGSQTAATFTAPSEPGDYQVVCKNAGHYVAGMIAKLTVVPAQ
jgi:uncharacterized cupredoxin-like copper-binding protein